MVNSRSILVCSCDDTMPLDAARWRGLPRGRSSSRGRQFCRAELERVSRARGRRGAGHDRLHAGSAAVPRGRERKRRRCVLRQFARDRRLVRRRREGGTEDGGACRGGGRCRCRTFRSFSSKARASSSSTGATSARSRRRVCSRSISTSPSLITRPDESDAAAHHRISDREGHDPRGQGPSRRVRDHRRRLCRCRGRPRAARWSSARHETAPYRAATSCSTSRAARRCSRPPICATAICAPIRAIPPRCSRRCCARAISSAASTSRATSTFTADLCAHSRSQHRRLPPLPRPLPDQRHRAGRRSRRDRRQDLRRLRPMRRRLPDRRGRLRAAARRCADAQTAHAAHGLSRGRRRIARSCSSTTRIMAAR